MSPRNYYLLILLMCFLGATAFGQEYEEIGNIPIRNFTPKEFGGTAQSHCIIEDKRGIIYVANNKGVLEYDGLEWSCIKITNEAQVTALAIDTNDVIYVGGQDEVGYLWPDSIGQLVFQSLSKQLNEKEKKFGDIKKVICYDGNIYFQAQEKVLIYDGASMITLGLKGLSKMGVMENELFAIQDGIGISLLKGTKQIIVLEENNLNGIEIKELLNLKGDQILLVSKKNGLFSLGSLNRPSPTLAPYPTQIDGFLRSNSISTALILRNGNISIGTMGQGIAVIDKRGTLMQFVNKRSNLQDATISYQYQDQHGSLWLALHSGISKLDISSNLVYFLKNVGLEGTIEKIARCNGHLYIGGNLGVYMLDNSKIVSSDSSTFYYSRLKKVLAAKCWDIIPFKSQNKEVLLVAANQGTFQINANQETKKISAYDPNVLFQSTQDPQRVYVGLFPGFASIYWDGAAWKDEPKIEDVDEKIFRIEMDETGDIWLGTNQPPSGPLHLSLSRYKGILSSVQINRYDTIHGLPRQYVHPVEGVNKILYVTTKGLYGFNKNQNSFSPYSELGEQFTNGNRQIHRLNTDKMGNAWMFTIDRNEKFDLGYAWPDQQGIYQWENTAFQGINDGIINSIYHENNGVTWLGGNHGLFRYDDFAKPELSKDFNALIRKVTAGHDKILFRGNYIDVLNQIVFEQPKNRVPVIQYDLNTVGFQFSAHSHEGKSIKSFSYFLKGFDKKWTPYKDETSVKFTNLKEGDYTFRVKGKNLYGYESREAIYSFSILPPWYRTMQAYVGYLLLIIGTIYGIVKISVYRLEKSKKQLEKIVTERTAEVVKQREVIEEKNKDITDSIKYAKNIQQAMLPTTEELEKMIPDSFLLFKPRDIVSGDFYWAAEKEGTVYYCAADCTGHGVPGAFVSMICSSLLSDAVKGQGLTEPADIFHFVRNGIIQHFKQGEGGQKDGMDATLCTLTRDNGQVTLRCACANNPLFVIRKTDDKLLSVTSSLNGKSSSHELDPILEENGLSLFQIKEDRQPVGFLSVEQQPFTNHKVQLLHGDIVYIFSDGFQDQFGGPKGKKFMIKRLKNLLVEVAPQPLDTQRDLLDKTLVEWINHPNEAEETIEQVDDVLFIGVKIK